MKPNSSVNGGGVVMVVEVVCEDETKQQCEW